MPFRPPTNAEEAKEWCIEWATESGHKASFTRHLHPKYISNLCLLDDELIERMDMQAPTAVGIDMETAINDTVERSNKTIYPETVNAWLTRVTTPAARQMKIKVEELMDSELKWFHIEELANMDFEKKAATIARERALRRILGPSSSSIQMKEQDPPKYQLHLSRLIGGHGRTDRCDDLELDYNLCFDEFLKVLQEATALCTIPPVDFTKVPIEQEPNQPLPYYPSVRDVNPLPKGRFRPLTFAESNNPYTQPSRTDRNSSDMNWYNFNTVWRRSFMDGLSPPEDTRSPADIAEWSSSTEEQRFDVDEHSSNTGGQSTSVGSELFCATDEQPPLLDQPLSDTAEQSSSDDSEKTAAEQECTEAVDHKSPKHRTRCQRGYTLEDGPWTYEISYKPTTGPFTSESSLGFERFEIRDENDYLKMLERLKEANRKGREGDYHIDMIHSQDSEMYTNWFCYESWEKYEDQQQLKEWREATGVEEGSEEDLEIFKLKWLVEELEKRASE